MIQLRFRSSFEPDWTLTTLDGPEEEAAYQLLAPRLFADAEWEIEISRDSGEWFVLGEEEDG